MTATPDASAASHPPRSKGKLILYAVIGVAVVAGLILAGRQAGAYVPRFAQWVASLGVWGPVVFILGYAVAAIAFIPGSLLTLAAGAIFGLVRGTIYTLIGATLGASGAFLVARYLARRAIERKIKDNARFAAIDKAVGREGFKIVALLRLSPIFPFNLLNYSLGLTQVTFLQYLAASIAMLPGTLLYVYYGKAAGSLAALAGGARTEKGAGSWVVLGLGLLATIVVTTFVTRLAGKALKQQIEPQQIDTPADSSPDTPEAHHG
jgi:uncharacterized membrane protein YdjX (TVP38/TMEM64 family)